MLFSTPIFLLYFLPLLLSVYFLSRNIHIKNAILLVFSLLFFVWGGIYFTLLLLISIAFNFLFGIGIENYKFKWVLIAGVTTNLSFLIWFKYANFFVTLINQSLSFTGHQLLVVDNILLPVGISFYTFHSISYLVDIYHNKAPAQKNIFNMALYIVLFTQLVAGPIIRYNTFAPQLHNRRVNLENFSEGLQRFIIGLAKKVLIAKWMQLKSQVVPSPKCCLSKMN